VAHRPGPYHQDSFDPIDTHPSLLNCEQFKFTQFLNSNIEIPAYRQAGETILKFK
jgi:hypothetical protein